MIVDAHQHFWLLAERKGQWPPASLAPLYRDFLPADLQPMLERCDVGSTVVVQSLPDIQDTEFLLTLADQHAFIRGVVGWADLKARDAAQQIAGLARHPRFKGLRPMLQDVSDDMWIADPALDTAVRAMREHKLCFDALVLPRQLSGLLWFARRHPELPIVIDHAAKPAISSGDLGPWEAEMAALAALPQVHCKFSGLLTEAGAGATVETIQPCVQAIYRLFGPQRLIWGSDWPVLRLATSYDAWLAMARQLCRAQPGADDAAIAAIFGGNARRFYRLD